MNGRILLALLLWLVCVVNVSGQINCATSTRLVCQLPFATGTTFAGTSTTAVQQAVGFNAPIAAQLSQLPLASSTSGIVALMSKGVPTSLENLGSILTDSPQTIGKDRIFVGFSFQQYNFNAVNGISLGKVPFVYSATDSTSSTTYWVQNVEHISFKYDQYVGLITVGLTAKTDFSVIIPINRVSIGVGNVGAQTQYAYNQSNQLLGTLTAQPPFVPGVASGIGDMLFNLKRVLWQDSSERATLSGGFLLRAPTGNAENYLGSGAWGFNPYGLFSYQARISPHARLGYQWNTSSVLINPTGGNQALPGGLQFDVGADAIVYKDVTVAVDVLGNQFLNCPTLVTGTVGNAGYQNVPVGVASLPTVVKVNSSYTVGYFSLGAKWNPWKNLLLYGNVLFQMNNVGLRSDPVPLLGVSYKF